MRNMETRVFSFQPADTNQRLLSGVQDFRFLSQFKHRANCTGGECGVEGTLAAPMIRALQESEGGLTGDDYRSKEVLAVYDYIHELGVGLVVKVDTDEMAKPATLAAIKLFSICLAFVVVFVIIQAYVTKRMLDSAEQQWMQSRAEVHCPCPWGRTVRCTKSRLFSTTGSHRSQGPEFCTLQPLLVHRGFFFFSLMLATGPRVLKSAPPMLF